MTTSPEIFWKTATLFLCRRTLFTAFVIEEHDVIGHVLFVVHDYLRAAFAKGLDDLGCLRPSSALRMRAPTSV